MIFYQCVCHNFILLLCENVDPPTSQPSFLPLLSSCSVSCKFFEHVGEGTFESFW